MNPLTRDYEKDWGLGAGDQVLWDGRAKKEGTERLDD